MIAYRDRAVAGELPADPRDALIQEQAKRLREQERRLAAQAEQIAALEAMGADLRDRLATAEPAGSRNSGNPSMPPSSDDLPGRRPSRKHRRTSERAEKKKRGKQPARPGIPVVGRAPGHRPLLVVTCSPLGSSRNPSQHSTVSRLS